MVQDSSSPENLNVASSGKLPARVVFVHIPKTGGTSLHEVLKGFFKPKDIHPERLNHFDRYDPDSFADYRYFSAHMDARTLPAIPDPKYTLTVLREPKARILSLYYFWKSHKLDFIEKHNLHGPRIAKSMDLLSFLKKRDEAIPMNTENAQARAVWGHLYLFRDDEPFVADPHTLSLILEAHDNFSMIGLMEKLDETLISVCRDFGVPSPPNLPRLQQGDVAQSGHAHRETVEREEITDEIDHQLDLLTVYDRPLYEHALKSFRHTTER